MRDRGGDDVCLECATDFERIEVRVGDNIQ